MKNRAVSRLGAQAGLAAFYFLPMALVFRDNARRHLGKEGTTMITLLVLAAAAWIGGAGLGV